MDCTSLKKFYFLFFKVGLTPTIVLIKRVYSYEMVQYGNGMY